MNSIARPFRMLSCSLLLAAFSTSAAPLRLREAISSVTVSASPDGVAQAVLPDTAVAPGQFVRTGSDSRAEFFAGRGVLRLGSQTTLLIRETGGIELEQGTALLDSLPKQSRLTIRLGNEPAVIEGGTGFVMVSADSEGKPAVLHVGSLAGRTVVRRGGDSLSLGPAQVLSLKADGNAGVGAFNLAKQLESCMLVHGFKSPLPGSKSIERAAVRFASLQRRGFVQLQDSPEAEFAEETFRRSLAQNDNSAYSGQTGSDISSQASLSHHPLGIVEGEGLNFSFRSRTATLADTGPPKGNNGGLGNGQDPPTPGWLNPRNPHFGSPQNDPPSPGNPGRDRGNRF